MTPLVQVCAALRMHLAIPTRLDFLLWTLQRLRWPTMYNTHRGRHEQVGMLAAMFGSLPAEEQQMVAAILM